MVGLALGLYLVYLLLAFGLRSWVQYRRTGSTGFRGVSGRPGSVEWWGGALFVLALLLGLAGLLLQLLGRVAPLEVPAVWPVGLVLTVVGIVATVVAQQAMGVSWRVGVDQHEATDLVTGGAFALVRNPVFTAMIGIGLGITLMAPNLVTVAALLVLVLAIEIQVRVVEELYLLRAHGASYRDYATRVGRLLPGIGRLAAGQASSHDR